MCECVCMYSAVSRSIERKYGSFFLKNINVNRRCYGWGHVLSCLCCHIVKPQNDKYRDYTSPLHYPEKCSSSTNYEPMHMRENFLLFTNHTNTHNSSWRIFNGNFYVLYLCAVACNKKSHGKNMSKCSRSFFRRILFICSSCCFFLRPSNLAYWNLWISEKNERVCARVCIKFYFVKLCKIAI